MSNDQIKQCRERVRNVLGPELARKASDELCTALAPSASTDAAHEAPRVMRVVVELAPRAPKVTGLREAAARIRASEGWSATLESARSALRESAAEGLGPREEALIDPGTLLRQVGVKEMRERCYRAASLIRAELDRGAVALASTGLERSADGFSDPAPRVQFCWLNQSFLAWVAPEALAGLADDPEIHRIDVPRPLELSIGMTGGVIGAVKHRKKFNRTGKGVVVAVIDSEVAPLPAVFQDRVIHKRNFTAEPWGHPHFHGTTVAGIIAARGPDVSGVAPEAVIFNYKVATTVVTAIPEAFHGALALEQALEDGADVANCSWNTRAPTDGTSVEARACDNAWAHGMTVVNSAGNKGPAEKSIECPADAKGVIVVGATSRDGANVQLYSGRGPAKNGKLCPDLVAPGGNNADAIESFLAEGGFDDCGFGTSFAAPHVAGVLALLLEAEPALTPDEQLQRLLGMCKKRPGQMKNVQGKGMISLDKLA